MPKMDESMLKNMMSQMANAEPEDFYPIMADIPTDAEDGESVALLVTGYAKGGKLTKIEATDFDMGSMPEKETGLKSMLSEKEDGDTQEDE